jgi:hypothetical protein
MQCGIAPRHPGHLPPSQQTPAALERQTAIAKQAGRQQSPCLLHPHTPPHSGDWRSSHVELLCRSGLLFGIPPLANPGAQLGAKHGADHGTYGKCEQVSHEQKMKILVI